MKLGYPPHDERSTNCNSANILGKFVLINAAIPLPREGGGTGLTRRTGFGRVDLKGSVKHILAVTSPHDGDAGSDFKMDAINIQSSGYINIATVTVPAHNRPRTLTVTFFFNKESLLAFIISRIWR